MRGSLRVALVSVFSALFFLVTEFVRGIPVLGLPRGRIQPSVVLVPLLGTVLGPAMGPLAALLGITAAAAYPAPSADPFSLLNIAAPALGTLCSALVTESGRRSVAGPLALLAALLSVWFATDQGVARFDGQTWLTYTRQDGLLSDWATSIAVDAEGQAWVGSTKGVSLFDGWDWITFGEVDGLPDARITSLVATADGMVWAGTERGLARFDGETWITYGIADGLADDAIEDIAVGPGGELWIATQAGVSSYAPEE